jgi:fatty-acyl-CoA synthase
LPNVSGAATAWSTRNAAAFELPLESPTRPAVDAGEAHGDQRNPAALRGCSGILPDRGRRSGVTARATALFIFTSGTTGLPKAARITHARAQLYMRGFAGATGARADDRIYVALPFYHATGGLCGAGAALLNGGQVVIRRRFSATQFWPEIVAERCTMFVYIGELCRYLANQPQVPEERQHALRLAFGNGLAPDVWEKFVGRFAVPKLLEFYGSTEGKVSMLPTEAGRIGRARGLPRLSTSAWPSSTSRPRRLCGGRTAAASRLASTSRASASARSSRTPAPPTSAMPTSPPARRRCCMTPSAPATPGFAPATC